MNIYVENNNGYHLVLLQKVTVSVCHALWLQESISEPKWSIAVISELGVPSPHFQVVFNVALRLDGDGWFIFQPKAPFFTEATLPAYCEFRSKCSDYWFSATSADFYSQDPTWYAGEVESHPFLCIRLVRRAFLSKSLFSRAAILKYRLPRGCFRGHCNFTFSSFKVNPYLST